MRICTRCKTEKPITDFYRDKSKKDGFRSWCKSCCCKPAKPRDKEKMREYARNYRERNREKDKIRHINYRERNYEECRKREKQRQASYRYKVGQMLRNAVAAGYIQKPERCQECKSKDNIHGHHEDYSKPYEVDWLCSRCHGKRHRKNGDANAS